MKLTGEFTSLEEPIDDFDFAVVMVFPIDGSNFVGSERQVEPSAPMQKFKLSIVRSIS
jgi:hypothetical protein